MRLEARKKVHHLGRLVTCALLASPLGLPGGQWRRENGYLRGKLLGEDTPMKAQIRVQSHVCVYSFHICRSVIVERRKIMFIRC
jgi:hypothetical protein